MFKECSRNVRRMCVECSANSARRKKEEAIEGVTVMILVATVRPCTLYQMADMTHMTNPTINNNSNNNNNNNNNNEAIS
jgi:hypothetical protein